MDECLRQLNGPQSTTDSTDATAEKESAATTEKESAAATEDTAEDSTTSLSEPILQSALLKASASLEQLANNAGSSDQKGSTATAEVKRIQQARLNMDFDLG